MTDRCRAHTGSMFDPLPRGADLYLVAIVIGDWVDEKATAILRRCAEAVDPEGRVLIVEAVLDEALAGSFAMDLVMLTISEGRARTLAQLHAIVQTAGLELVRTYPMPSGRCALECARRGLLEATPACRQLYPASRVFRRTDFPNRPAGRRSRPRSE